LDQGVELVAHLLAQADQRVTRGQALLQLGVDGRRRPQGAGCNMLARRASVRASMASVVARWSSALATLWAWSGLITDTTKPACARAVASPTH